MKNDVIELASIARTTDEDGFETETELTFECMADVESVRRTEFYQAAMADIKVSLSATVNYADYRAAKEANSKTPSKVNYDGDSYRIVRTYREKKHNTITLYLSEVV
jgi:SPP1 family predicted phage head-tail adaptor